MEIDRCPSETNICRLNSRYSAAELRRILGDRDWLVWQEDSRLNFAYRGESSQIHLGGAINTSLTPVSDSDFWAVTLRVNRLDEAIIRHWLMVYEDAQQIHLPQTLGVWRGGKAPAAPAFAETLAGEIREVTLYSEELGEDRHLSCYLPAGFDRAKTYPVIYMTDGDMFAEFEFANVVEPLIADSIIPQVVLVAVHSAPFVATHDRRGEEYVPGHNDETYNAHEQFFVESVRNWAETSLGVSSDPKNRAILGYSRGAVFVGNTSLRNPGIYQHVMMFSPGDDLQVDRSTETDSRYYLLAGTLEEHFLEATKRSLDSLQRANIDASLVQRVAGHASTMWVEEFPRAVRWMFGESI